MLWVFSPARSLRPKNKPGIGLLIHAAKSGQKPSLTKPGCGWKEWADEAIKRRLMQYSHSQDGDIMVHFVSGTQGLWSRLRGLSWVEVERFANGGRTYEQLYADPQKAHRPARN